MSLALGQGAGREMPCRVVGEVFVGLVAEMIETSIAAKAVDRC